MAKAGPIHSLEHMSLKPLIFQRLKLPTMCICMSTRWELDLSETTTYEQNMYKGMSTYAQGSVGKKGLRMHIYNVYAHIYIYTNMYTYISIYI